MLLDYKLNKSLIGVGDKLHNGFINYLSQFNELKITNTKLTETKKVCYCIILNVAYQVSKGLEYVTLTLDKNSYSNPAIYNGYNTGRKVSYRYMMMLLSYLENSTFSVVIRGGVTEWEYDVVNKGMKPKLCESSRLVIDESVLNDVVNNLSNFNTRPSVIEVRDKSGKPIGVRLSESEKRLVSLLEGFNLKLDTSSVSIKDEKFQFYVKKIYNNSSLKEGGRIFMLGNKISNLVERESRRQIVINGIPTVELDYAQLWPRIAADLVGQELDSDFDVYGVEIQGYCNCTMRDLCKVGLMCLLNADSFESAYYATLKELKSSGMQEKIEKAKSKGEWQEFPIIRKMLDMLMDRNAYLIDYFFAKKATFLMNIESSLMDYILERAVEDDRILVPIHDSVIVQEDYAKIAETNMYKAYEVVVGGKNCVVRVK